MTNLTNAIMKNKSLALKSDAHLKALDSYIKVKKDNVIVNDYAYVDYDVVSGGVIFFFIPFEKWVNNSWDNSDQLEVFVEFTEQRLYKEIYDPIRGVIQGEQYRLIDNDHEAFDLAEGLREAEYKAFEYIINKE